MTKPTTFLSATAACAVSCALLVAAPAYADIDNYKIADLLSPCVEGDNDSRGGAVLELECEQYVAGFTDLYVRAGLAKKDGVCLPDLNRDDEVRWAFMRWAHENYGERGKPAVDGLLATLKARFKC